MAQRKVDVFFPKHGEPPDPLNNPLDIHPVKRLVDANAPLRPALEALLAGPNKSEQQQGFQELDANGLTVADVRITDGDCQIKFLSKDGKRQFKSEDSFFAFNESLEKTVFQFSTIQLIHYSVDGLSALALRDSEPQREVSLFFQKDSAADEIVDDNPFNLQPVARFIDPRAPARPTLEEWLFGPNEFEQDDGFRGLGVRDLSIGSLSIKEGTCEVDFSVSKEQHPFRDDLVAVIFADAVERTPLQFPIIRKVVISIDGELNFRDSGF